MDSRSFSGRYGSAEKCRPMLKRSVSLKLPVFSRKRNPFSILKFWGSKSDKNSSFRSVNNPVYMESCSVIGENGMAKNGDCCKIRDVLDNGGGGLYSGEESSSSSWNLLASEITVNDGHDSSSDDSSSSFPPSTDWPAVQVNESIHSSRESGADEKKPPLDHRKLEKLESSLTETEMMKERLSKLLLGEDMSGCGNGVSTALAISNAITNLCATIFGQIWRLEPLPTEKKIMWRREIEWLLCVSDHIVELTPCLQTLPDGTKLEIMTSRPRSDLYVNLPALRKLDNMLLGILDSFEYTEFWYVDQGITTSEDGGSSSFRKLLPRQEEKWWLPVPRVPVSGLSEDTRKSLQQRRDSTSQILKAAMAINSITLADMKVPDAYLEALPKNPKSNFGDVVYNYMNSEQFSPECLLECLDLSSDYQALELANKVETAIYVWRRKNNSKSLNTTNKSGSKSSWGIIKDFVSDTDKRELLADRAESLLMTLKLQFPGLSQTSLDTSKIQYNKDVGKSILESYSRVLESLAFNILARIDDLLYMDDLTKHSDQPLSLSKVGTISHKNVVIVPAASCTTTPYKTAFSTPSFSPLQRASSARMNERSSSAIVKKNNSSPHNGGYSVKKVLTDYFSNDSKRKESVSPVERRSSKSLSGENRESLASESVESYAVSSPLIESSAESPQQD